MTVVPSRPTMVSLATMASMMASSVASTTPLNSGSMVSLGRKRQSLTPPSTAQAVSLAVDVNELTAVTAVATDYIAIEDVDDSNTTKKALISDIVARLG